MIPICILNVTKRTSNGTASCKNRRHGAYKQADYRTDGEDDTAICLSTTPTHISVRLPTTYLPICLTTYLLTYLPNYLPTYLSA